MSIPVTSEATRALARVLSRFAPRVTITRAAALLTVPSFQANNIRIELLVHLALAHCTGNDRPTLEQLGRWLNTHLGDPSISSIEDPVEDVFVTTVGTARGNRRLFPSLWDSGEYYVQTIIDVLSAPNAPEICGKWLSHIMTLLDLSDAIAERLNLPRWCHEPSAPQKPLIVSPALHIEDRSRAITFTNESLNRLGISRDDLQPFIFNDEDKQHLLEETTGNTSLDRRPLVDFGDALVVALPHAVSVAIRRYILEELSSSGHFDAFEVALQKYQAAQVEKTGLLELRGKVQSLPPPTNDGLCPTLTSWLFRYDQTKCIHVILLHDPLASVIEHGFSGFSKMEEPFRTGLESYISKVAAECFKNLGATEGFTILLHGGLGRGIFIGFREIPNRWHLAHLTIPDLMILAWGAEEPLVKFLKCCKQRDWAENEGVEFFNLSGDFNIYCYWRESKYQILPADMKASPNSVLTLMSDFIFPVRMHAKRLTDIHLVQTTADGWANVVRLGTEAYFEAIRHRPVYASVTHLQSGILAGVAETTRGPTWLSVTNKKDSGHEDLISYELWAGFIELLEKVASIVESRTKSLIQGPLEITLDLKLLTFDADNLSLNTEGQVPAATIEMSDSGRHATVLFPVNYISLFHQVDNAGERYTLEALVRALLHIHLGTNVSIDENNVSAIVNEVAGTPGLRILHVFRTQDPVEGLLEHTARKPKYFAYEDYAFCQIGLSDGCTTLQPKATISTKRECNEFLHKVVDKLWNAIRDTLGHMNRTSIISHAFHVHDGLSRDRMRWKRTALALLSLYQSKEDVIAVARSKERDRNNTTLAARTIIEMALCECPVSDGRQVSQWEFDELLAKALLLFETAANSDAIFHDLVPATILLQLNGSYVVDETFHEKVLRPFTSNIFQRSFEDAAKGYSKLYETRTTDRRVAAEEVFDHEYVHAFETEFNLSLDQALDGIAELILIAAEATVVTVETNVGEILERLSKNRNFSAEVSHAFLNLFALEHRADWSVPPAGYDIRDISPWRFRRRLSLASRPLVIYGRERTSKALYSAELLRTSALQLFSRVQFGELPDRFFKSTEMLRYWGFIRQKVGTEFEDNVAQVLRGSGWSARRVRMTEIGAPEQLGDIDVLAWNAKGEVLVGECKHLMAAKTVAEIAEICRRFRGEAKDELDRHIQRAKWIRANPMSLVGITKFAPSIEDIDDRLITSVQVPFRYLDSLPLSADKIISYVELQEWCRPV